MPISHNYYKLHATCYKALNTIYTFLHSGIHRGRPIDILPDGFQPFFLLFLLIGLNSTSISTIYNHIAPRHPTGLYGVRGIPRIPSIPAGDKMWSPSCLIQFYPNFKHVPNLCHARMRANSKSENT